MLTKALVSDGARTKREAAKNTGLLLQNTVTNLIFH